MFRVQNNVPEPYIEQSRDFQLIGRLYDCIINGVKFDIDSMQNLVDTEVCNERLLQLLQTKLGFFTDKEITSEELRYALKAFPYIIKWKGSLKSIKDAVYVFLKLKHISTEIDISVVNKSDSDPYTITICLETYEQDTTILDEILKYIIPTGYRFKYMFYKSLNNNDEEADTMNTNAEIIYISDLANSTIRYGNYIWKVDEYTTKKSTDTVISGTGESPFTKGINASYAGMRCYNENFDGSGVARSWTAHSMTDDGAETIGSVGTVELASYDSNQNDTVSESTYKS